VRGRRPNPATVLGGVSAGRAEAAVGGQALEHLTELPRVATPGQKGVRVAVLASNNQVLLDSCGQAGGENVEVGELRLPVGFLKIPLGHGLDKSIPNIVGGS